MAIVPPYRPAAPGGDGRSRVTLPGMDPLELPVGDILLSFDGRVLELFGFPGHSRFHVGNLEIEFRDPDRKGNQEVVLRAGTQRTSMIVGAENREAVMGVLAEVQRAMPPAV